jgi:uncharacterized protein (UPF0332 family)
MKSTLDKLTQQGFIEKQEIGFDQIIKHLSRAQKDLRVAKANLEIDSEAAYNYSYLAMLRSGRALMFSFGYRPIDGRQHKTVVEFTDIILGKEFSLLISYFDKMRKLRNRFTYDEPEILVSRTQAEQSLKKAREMVRRVSDFIQKQNPQKKLL